MFVIFYVCAKADSVSRRLSNITNSTRYCITEADLVYDFNDEVTFVGTFFKCLGNVQDALTAPFYTTGKTINVSSQILINSLISLDELTNSYTFDCFLFYQWTDPRLSMPALFAAMKPLRYAKGIDITQVFTDVNIHW